MANEMNAGRVNADEYNVGELLRTYVDEGGDAVSFGTLGSAANTAVGNLLENAPALLQATLPSLAGAAVTVIADTGLNLLGDVVMGRDIDWGQTFANMGVDFLFSLFLNGKSGDNAYVDPETGKNIDIPAGKTLADIDPETARFYNALGDTKVTGELHTAIGDMYTSYLDIPEGVVSRIDFWGLETAYRNYEANNTVANAAAFIDEAGRVYARAGESGYRISNPYDTMNTAIEADFAARQGIDGIGRNGYNIGQEAWDDAYSRYLTMLDEVEAANNAGVSARDFAASKGVVSTLTDEEAALGLRMLDEDERSAFNSTPELENHIQYTDTSVPRSRGIGGAHNSEEFFRNDVNIVRAIPSEDIPGVTYYEYTMPLLGKDGRPVGGYGTTIFYKTVYDPRVFSHSEYIRRGLEAANDSYMINGILSAAWEGYDLQGVRWSGYGKNGKPISFYPHVPQN